ncbi:MAG: hypothetical protein ACRCU2_03455 [Planktothrix sp.]
MKVPTLIRSSEVTVRFNPVAGIHCNESTSHPFLHRHFFGFNPVAGIHCNERGMCFAIAEMLYVSIPLPGFIVMKADDSYLKKQAIEIVSIPLPGFIVMKVHRRGARS